VDRQRETIRARTGLTLEISRVAVRDTSRPRPEALGAIIGDDAMAVATDPDVDVVVEVMGGIGAARGPVLAALAAGKPVVTANKALLADCGTELFAAAESAGVDLLFEAAVAGGIPFIRPLRESLLAEPVVRVMGIVNGTTNFILTRMSEGGAGYADALSEAQRLGYAEADPTADVEGIDAAAKIAIVASIAFGAVVTADDVGSEGISGVTSEDIAFAERHGYAIKLLAVAERFPTSGGDELAARVHPALIPIDHPLASVRDSFNAIFVQGEAVGDLMFYGRGAGGDPTASAVLGDLVDAAMNLRRGTHASLGSFAPMPFRSGGDLSAAWYLSLRVDDRPGVLASIAGVFADHGVSIDSMEQHSLSGLASSDEEARIDLIIHPAPERDVRATLEALRALAPVRSIGSTIRVLVDAER
jgi:homoserine dehydrogenase